MKLTSFPSTTALAFVALTVSAQARLSSHVVRQLEDTNLAMSEQSRNSSVDEEVIGGRPSFPYRWFVDTDGCGGSLVARDMVLSAAHCHYNQQFQVVVGAYDQDDPSAHPSETIMTEQEFVHPGFVETDEFIRNDYLLIKLERAVTNSNLELIKLADENFRLSTGQKLTVMGMGHTSYPTSSASSSSILREAEIAYISTAECNNLDDYKGTIEADNMMCAGSNPLSAGGVDACRGDSGSPLILKSSTGPIQVGLVSWGIGCALPNVPGVYAWIPGGMPWIRETVCRESSDPPDWACSPPNSVDGGPQLNDGAEPPSTPAATDPATTLATTPATTPATTAVTTIKATDPADKSNDGAEPPSTPAATDPATTTAATTVKATDPADKSNDGAEPPSTPAAMDPATTPATTERVTVTATDPADKNIDGAVPPSTLAATDPDSISATNPVTTETATVPSSEPADNLNDGGEPPATLNATDPASVPATTEWATVPATEPGDKLDDGAEPPENIDDPDDGGNQHNDGAEPPENIDTIDDPAGSDTATGLPSIISMVVLLLRTCPL